jgi:hypothetical protein
MKPRGMGDQVRYIWISIMVHVERKCSDSTDAEADEASARAE